jgi:hypothetical protein
MLLSLKLTPMGGCRTRLTLLSSPGRLESSAHRFKPTSLDQKLELRLSMGRKEPYFFLPEICE